MKGNIMFKFTDFLGSFFVLYGTASAYMVWVDKDINLAAVVGVVAYVLYWLLRIAEEVSNA